MRAATRAYSIVRDGILSGRHIAGSRLTEQELASAVGVSRTPIREALRRLHAEGLVHFEPNHGAVVALFADEDADDIFELRALLEPVSASRAAERTTATTIAELRALAEQQYRVSVERGNDFLLRIADLNDKFHRLVQAAARSVRLVKTLVGLIEAPIILMTFGQYSEGELLRSGDQHLELVQAIEARDSKWAHSIMQAHILAGLATYLRSRRSLVSSPRTVMSETLDENYAKGGFGHRLALGRRPAVLVIDFVMAYMLKTSPLYAGVEATREAAVRLLGAARAAGLPIVHTFVEYEPGGRNGGVFFRKVPALRSFERGAHPDRAASRKDLNRLRAKR
jgi:DNA-binding GntR family transcriptional regulator